MHSEFLSQRGLHHGLTLRIGVLAYHFQTLLDGLRGRCALEAGLFQ